MVQDEQDREWLARIRAGDDHAFDALMDRYQRPVLAFIFRMVPDAAAAEDMAQETFVKAYRAIQRKRFRPTKAAVSTWLFQIARNVARDALRKAKRKPLAFFDQMPEGSSAFSAQDGGSPAEHAAAHELQQIISQALQRLPADQRSALILSVYHECSQAEIAAILRCSIKSVESRIYRARNKLDAWLRPAGGGV